MVEAVQEALPEPEPEPEIVSTHKDRLIGAPATAER